MRIEAAPPDAQPLLSFESLTLGEVIRLTNKYSNNLMARQLFLTIGEDRYGAPATPDKGTRAIADWSRERGLPLADLVIDNGSGLSRNARISALDMATHAAGRVPQPLGPRVHRLASACRNRRHPASPACRTPPRAPCG